MVSRFSEPSECAFPCLEDENCNSENFGTGVLDGGEHVYELLSQW